MWVHPEDSTPPCVYITHLVGPERTVATKNAKLGKAFHAVGSRASYGDSSGFVEQWLGIP